MKIVIVGCGRVGSVIAESLDSTGHEVLILDIATRSFTRLPESFRGQAIRGDGTDEDTLQRVGAAGADLFLALTEGDNRNVMAAQIAIEALGAKKVVAKINDPVRAAAYAELGINALCRTTMMSDAIHELLGLPTSGLPGILPSSDRHHGPGHGSAAQPAAAGAADAREA